MDDETYVKSDFRQLLGLLCFATHHKFDVPEYVRKQKMSQFAKKIHDLASNLLMWKAKHSICDNRDDQRAGIHKGMPPKASTSTSKVTQWF